MTHLNSVLLEGNLTAPPTLQDVGESQKATFTLATNRNYRNGEGENVQKTVFIEVQSWGAMAVACTNHLVKGQGVRIAGRLEQDRWEKDGEKHQKYYLVAEHIEFGAKPSSKKTEKKGGEK